MSGFRKSWGAIARTYSNINYRKVFLDTPLRWMKNKPKIKKQNLINPKSICTTKETQNERQLQPGMGRNICKWRYQQGIHLHNKQGAPSSSKSKTQQPKTQVGQTQRWIFLGGRHRYCDSAHENMLSISHSDTKANQKSDVISPHISQDGHLKTPESMSPALAGRVFTTSTTWEALLQYKKTMTVQKKV